MNDLAADEADADDGDRAGRHCRGGCSHLVSRAGSLPPNGDLLTFDVSVVGRERNFLPRNRIVVSLSLSLSLSLARVPIYCLLALFVGRRAESFYFDSGVRNASASWR
jgi:hypothetical protein